MVRKLGLLAVLFLAVSCGKNDPIVPIGGYGPGVYPVQAPPPPGYLPPAGYPGGGYPIGGGYPPAGGGYYPPGGSFPPGGNPGGGFPPGVGGQPYAFQPQMPPSYPIQYYPFLPLYNYFQQNQQMQMYWAQFWAQWQQYAQMRGYQQYDFSRFWTDYCPQQWSQGGYDQVYGYFNQSFYYWVTPQTQFSYNVDPSTFWSNCYDYPYPSYQMNWCDAGCY